MKQPEHYEAGDEVQFGGYPGKIVDIIEGRIYRVEGKDGPIREFMWGGDCMVRLYRKGEL